MKTKQDGGDDIIVDCLLICRHIERQEEQSIASGERTPDDEGCTCNHATEWKVSEEQKPEINGLSYKKGMSKCN